MLRALSLALPLICGLTPALAKIVGGTDPADTWHLIGAFGQPATAPLYFSLDPAGGKISGHAPCNLFFGSTTGDLPALSMKRLAVTRRTCPEIGVENRYLSALEAVETARFSDDRLFLKGPDGVLMELARATTDPSGQPTPCLSCKN